MIVLCPRCQRNHYTPYGEPWERGDPLPPALSRTTRGADDAPIYVCSPCGQDEAMKEFFHGETDPPEDWPVEIQFMLEVPRKG
jgi:hypothetical protein